MIEGFNIHDFSTFYFVKCCLTTNHRLTTVSVRALATRTVVQITAKSNQRLEKNGSRNKRGGCLVSDCCVNDSRVQMKK